MRKGVQVMAKRSTAVAESKRERRPPIGCIEAAEYTGQTHWTLRNHAARGILPSYRLGNKLKFSPDDLDAYLEERKRPKLVK
jgi:excisionase family DNA binding protein